MIHYSIDTNPRPRVHVVLALISLGIGFGLSWFFEQSEAKVLTPSVFAIYGLIFIVFDRYLWKMKPIRVLAGIPDISGVYRGDLSREITDYGEPGEFDLEAIVSQSWTKIDILVENELIVSNVTTCGFFVENSDSMKLVCTQILRERSPDPEKNMYGESTQEFRISIEPTVRLWGPYYSTKRHRGTVTLSRIDD